MLTQHDVAAPVCLCAGLEVGTGASSPDRQAPEVRFPSWSCSGDRAVGVAVSGLSLPAMFVDWGGLSGGNDFGALTG